MATKLNRNLTNQSRSVAARALPCSVTGSRNEPDPDAREAENVRIRHENAYLITRVIEVETELRDALGDLRQTFSGLHALEGIKLLKASELAKSFQVSADRIYELVRTQGLPAVYLGSHQIRFDPIAVRRWLDEGGRSTLEATQDLETRLRTMRN